MQKTFHYFWEETEMLVPLGMKMYVLQAVLRMPYSDFSYLYTVF